MPTGVNPECGLIAAGELLGSVLEQGAVAVAEEAEVVGEGVVVDLVPVVADECADQQEQGALRLVEVGYHAAHDVVLVARGNDDLRAGVQHLLASLVHVVE